ncbi:hypothetical protein F1559_002164 [Cyanidiococcus yangmingshanensis]|uniref:Uncharacterized protein n=1 Tax=Cyanidiococcus yangmingshanensis TaxID=2690220 RepID=A0A7J7ILA6_9RHOD|nr:hypothetical protein F1559_002164 [Cyanidiococcus yangmingshanensis]
MFTRISLLASGSSDERIRKNQCFIHADVLFHRIRVFPQIFHIYSTRTWRITHGCKECISFIKVTLSEWQIHQPPVQRRFTVPADLVSIQHACAIHSARRGRHFANAPRSS